MNVFPLEVEGPTQTRGQHRGSPEVGSLTAASGQWIRMTYDTGCAIIAFPEKELSPEVTKQLEEAGNGHSYKTASSELIKLLLEL